MVMNKIIIIGTGGHSAEIDDYITLSKQKQSSFPWEIIGYLDDNPAGYDLYQFSGPFLGSIKEHTIRKDCHYLMGIANLRYRRPIIEKFLNEGAAFATFIHPSATVSPSATIGQGVVLAMNVNVGPNVVIGDYTLVNSRCSLGHDTTIGKFNFISPNVCFSGFTSIGDENLFGINSATIPGISVGNQNKIMAGMVLDKNVGDDEVVFFRFKEKIIAISK
jgi:sugar O-acyltransferase (sialic acid O-acetyltransferase NeuD family)